MSISPGSRTAADSVTAPSTAHPIDQCQLALEITRGQTRFPCRPISGSRFLIGAGVTCHLRIGGDGMPALHSLIVRDGSTLSLEAIHPVPPLLVNGRVTRFTHLKDGDVIGIGEVEMVARRLTDLAPTQMPAAAAPQAASEVSERPLDEMSANELVEVIEREEHEVEQFEAQREIGAQALLQAALNRSRQSGVVPHEAVRTARVPAPHFLSKRPQVLAARDRQAVPAVDDRFARELEQVGRELSTLSREIQATTDRASQREAEIIQATDALLENQEKLAGQLEAVIDHVAAQQAADPAPRPRAIA